jgi:hypothetical protein
MISQFIGKFMYGMAAADFYHNCDWMIANPALPIKLKISDDSLCHP